MANSKSSSVKNTKTKWYLIGGIGLVVIAGLFFLFQYIFDGLPSLEELENPSPMLASNVYSSDGELIGQFFRENRIETNMDSIPSHVTNLLIATEDRKFYDHWGVDLQRFVKAMFKTIFLFKKEGASTITQQLSKNLYQLKKGRETIFDTGIRKIQEWITSVQIEKTYTKREILEMYFNVSYFGRGAYGIETAAKLYFNKRVFQLTVPEAALLIALLKSTVEYDPINKYDNALRRRNLVMFNMIEPGYLTPDEYLKYKKQPINLAMEELTLGFKSKIAPHFVEYIRHQMQDLADIYNFNLYEDGLSIYTTLDSRMQIIANESVKKHLEDYQILFDKHWKWENADNAKSFNNILDKAIKNSREYRNAESESGKSKVYQSLKRRSAFVDSVKKSAQTIESGFVVLDVKTGEIRAMVGGKNPNFAYGLNHVTQIRRQPGSAFKPIIYTVAIENGLYPAYPILNQRFNYNGWSPENFDRTTSGFTTLRTGLRNSLNIIASRLIIEDYVQLWQVGRVAEKLGIKSKLILTPAIALGTSEVSPLELTSAFATIAHSGIYNEPIAITKIEDKDGILIDSFISQAREAIPEETAYIITNMLQTVVDHGTGYRARAVYNFLRPAGGKTGTTQDYSDAWFVGFTPQLCAGVWVGFDDRRVSFTGTYGTGSQAALPVWAVFMKRVHDEIDIPLELFEKPTSGKVTTVNFCEESIFEFGDPRLSSGECSSGDFPDIINVKDLPPPFVASRDMVIKVPDRYTIRSSTTHEAVEIE
ncbi:MAG: PBP1A family penicillin-binding protein [bacterium]